MVYREQTPKYSAPFFKKYGINPYPIDLQTMDLEGDFLQGLMSSVRAGYDRARPIIIAKSEDQRLDGYVLDGRHRLYVLGKLLEQGVALPSPFPVSFVDVKDADHVRALIASYEEKGISKGSKYAKQHIQANLKAIVEDNYEKQPDIKSYIESLGFSNRSIIDSIVDTFIETKEQKQKRKNAKNHGKLESGASPKNHVMPDIPNSDKPWVSPVDGDRTDVIVYFRDCPCCKDSLKIVNDTSGGLLELTAAKKIAQ
jgi:hypothetical protein